MNFSSRKIAEGNTRPNRYLCSFNNRRARRQNLEFCCSKRIIPYLVEKEEDIIIKIDILREFKRSGIEYVSTLAELGRFLHQEVVPTKVQGKTHRVIKIPMQKLLDFLFPSF